MPERLPSLSAVSVCGRARRYGPDGCAVTTACGQTVGAGLAGCDLASICIWATPFRPNRFQKIGDDLGTLCLCQRFDRRPFRHFGPGFVIFIWDSLGTQKPVTRRSGRAGCADGNEPSRLAPWTKWDGSLPIGRTRGNLNNRKFGPFCRPTHSVQRGGESKHYVNINQRNRLSSKRSTGAASAHELITAR